MDRQHQAWSHRFPVLAHNTTPPGGKNMLQTMNATHYNRAHMYYSCETSIQKHQNALDLQIYNLMSFTEQEQQMGSLIVNFLCCMPQS